MFEIPQARIDEYSITTDEANVLTMGLEKLRHAAMDLLNLPISHRWRVFKKRKLRESLMHPFQKPLFEDRDAEIAIALREKVGTSILVTPNTKLERFAVLAFRGANWKFLMHTGLTTPYHWMRLALLVQLGDMYD